MPDPGPVDLTTTEPPAGGQPADPEPSAPVQAADGVAAPADAEAVMPADVQEAPAADVPEAPDSASGAPADADVPEAPDAESGAPTAMPEADADAPEVEAPEVEAPDAEAGAIETFAVELPEPPPVEPAPEPAPGPDRTAASLSRRRFIIGSTALIMSGLAAGSALTLLAIRMRPGASGGTPGAAPFPDGTPAGPTPAPSRPPTPTSNVGAKGSPAPSPIEAGPPPGPGRVRLENQLTGNPEWEFPFGGGADAEGYAGDVSLAPGDMLNIHVSSEIANGTITIFRLGWYDGHGARAVARFDNVRLKKQAPARTDPYYGTIRAPWAPALSTIVPDDWVSGCYLAVIAPDHGGAWYAPFVVREPAPTARILFVSSATTYQAYNVWGGRSMYAGESHGKPTMSGAANSVIASFDRPFSQHRGSGLMIHWEYPFIRWAEARGYDLAYCADMDLERHPDLLADRRLILLVGHPEYFSIPMRRNLEAAIAAGTNVAFFCANEIYWRTRYEDAAEGRYRTVTCYRYARLDPLAATDPTQATVKWRDAPSPDPEARLVGQMYGHIVARSADFVCTAPDHWVYAGTGMAAGDRIANLVGQEYDTFYPDPGLAPDGTQVLSVSPVRPNFEDEVPEGTPDPGPPKHVSNSTIYTAPSGATVFAAGTFQWSWALDGWGNPQFQGIHTPVDPRVGRITANILDRLG